jgi:hypothetical protein
MAVGIWTRRREDLAVDGETACEDLLRASTPPQVEAARTYKLAKCRGNEG